MKEQPVGIARVCLRDPIPEIADAARYLDAAVSAYLASKADLAEELIRLADMPIIREWTESIWGNSKLYVRYRAVQSALLDPSSTDQVRARMPTPAEKRELRSRDGRHCRFCGIPVIQKEVRERIRKVFPIALPWGKPNAEQHAAFQAMWLQYDHLLPHSRGGSNDVKNTVVTCAPCNFGRMEHSLEEVGLIDPRTREPVRSTWDGLERFPRDLSSTRSRNCSG